MMNSPPPHHLDLARDPSPVACRVGVTSLSGRHRIYTMCLPVPKTSPSGSGGGDTVSLGSGLADLQRTRDVVVAEVRKAPKRRIDNMITRLADSVHLLHMHATVCATPLSTPDIGSFKRGRERQQALPSLGPRSYLPPAWCLVPGACLPSIPGRFPTTGNWWSPGGRGCAEGV